MRRKEERKKKREKEEMGSLDSPRERENGNGGCRSPGDPKIGDGGMMIVVESEAMKKRRASMLPLEVGTRVMCRWRDSKYHPVKVIERRKMPSAGPNDYEYYVHYTECIISHSFPNFCFHFPIPLLVLGLGFSSYWKSNRCCFMIL